MEYMAVTQEMGRHFECLRRACMPSVVLLRYQDSNVLVSEFI